MSVETFNTGASRDADENKPDLEGFVCPAVQEEYGKYMHKHRFLSDGTLRDSDNWQKGIPENRYAQCLVRHTHQFHMLHRGWDARDYQTDEPLDIKETLCAVIFNASGYLHELLKKELEEKMWSVPSQQEFEFEEPQETTTDVVENKPSTGWLQSFLNKVNK